jgi:hypothetical protein
MCPHACSDSWSWPRSQASPGFSSCDVPAVRMDAVRNIELIRSSLEKHQASLAVVTGLHVEHKAVVAQQDRIASWRVVARNAEQVTRSDVHAVPHTASHATVCSMTSLFCRLSSPLPAPAALLRSAAGTSRRQSSRRGRNGDRRTSHHRRRRSHSAKQPAEVDLAAWAWLERRRDCRISARRP